MRPLLPSPCSRAFWLALAFAVVALPRAAAADPVLELANVFQIGNEINPNDPADVQKEVKRQKELLEKHAAAVTRLGDMRRALLLPEWKQGEAEPLDEFDPLGKVYREIWGKLADRLTKALRSRLAAKDDAGQRLAVVTFLAEMASAERNREQGEFVNPGMPRGIRREGSVIRFTPRMAADLRELLAKDKDADVRATAARAVVEIAPTEATTLDALKPLLAPERKLVERRAAAEGLGRMFGALADLQQQRPLPINQVGSRIVSAAGSGLGDKEAAIRRLCLETIQNAVQQIQQVLGHRGQQQLLAVYRPLAGAVNEQMAAVIGLLADGDLAVRLSAHQVLENIAGAQRRLPEALEEFKPPLTPPRPGVALPPPQERELGEKKPKANPDNKGAKEELPRHEPTAAPFNFEGIVKALPALKKNLADENERIRLASLYVLETLNFAAAPAVEEVAKALKDKNGFVRWGAARVLNNMAPQMPDKAVPALAEALSDKNKTVRLTAVAALQRYGPKATAAVKSLGKAIGDPEPRMRMGAINALALIGAKARPESGALVQVLKADKTPEVRAAAAKALGRLERFDAEAVKALCAALRDSDGTVRQAASDTLLDARP
jgi:HEAT repeat protein